MEESNWRENSIYDRDERRFTVRFRRSLGGLENPETQGWLRTCTIITGQPNELVAEIHTRMPVILPPENHERWLTGEAGKEILLLSAQTNVINGGSGEGADLSG